MTAKTLLVVLLTANLAGAVPEDSPAYLEASAAFSEHKYALARNLTEKMLQAQPDDYAALYLMGLIYQYGEGSIPRAYYGYSRTRTLLEKAGYNSSGRSGPLDVSLGM